MSSCSDGTALPTWLDANTRHRYSKTSLSKQHEWLVVLAVSRSENITGDFQRKQKKKKGYPMGWQCLSLQRHLGQETRNKWSWVVG